MGQLRTPVARGQGCEAKGFKKWCGGTEGARKQDGKPACIRRILTHHNEDRAERQEMLSQRQSALN